MAKYRITSIPQFKDGGEKRKKRNRWKNVTNENPNPEATRTPIDPRYIEQNPDTAPYYLNQPEVALTPRGKNWITSTPKYAGLYINPETGKLEQDKSKLATGSAEMVYPEKYFIGPGGGLVGAGIKGLERISAASIPGLARIPGATVGNALGAGFAADALVNRLPEGVTQLNNGEYIDAAGNIITGLLDVAGAGMISPIYQGAKSTASELGAKLTASELGNLAMKTGIKTLQLPGVKPFLRSNYNPISYPIKLLGEKIARQSMHANRNKKQVIAALTKKAAPEEDLYFGNTHLSTPEYGYGKRDLIANYFRGIDTGFKPIDYDIYSDPGLKKYIDRYGPLKTYELNSSVKHGQPLDIANFTMKLNINDSKLSNFDHDLYEGEFFQMPGLEDYYYNEYMRNLPGTSTPSPYEAQRQYYKKMLHQYFDERGIETLPLDVAPGFNANVKNYLDLNPVISFDDIAGHMGYLKRLPNKKDFEFTTRDIWKFTPDDYHSKWEGSSNKNELFKQLQVEAMDAFGKPIVLTQTNPIKFKNGGSMELELTPKQIKEYIKAGYIIEDISVPTLTRMQPGGLVPNSTYTPIDPNFLAENPDVYSQIVNKPEVALERQASDIGKLRLEYRDKNPMDIFLDEKKRKYLKRNKGLNKAAGVTMENFPDVVLQNFINEYDYKTNNYAVNKLGKKEGWNPKRRGEWVDELTPGERDAVAESKYGSKLQPSYWSRSLAGLATLASPYSPEIQKAMNEGNMPGLTKNESKEILNSKVLGIPIGGLETLAVTDLPGVGVANLVKSVGLSTGSDYKELPNVLSGEKMANVEDKDVMALNLLNYAGLEALPELGINVVKGARNLSRGVGKNIAKGYEALATGNSPLPIAWKVEESSPLKSILQNKNYNLTDEEAEIINDYIKNPYIIKSSPEKSKMFTDIIQKNQVDLSNINQPISRFDNYYVSSYDRDPLPTEYGSTFSYPRDRSWSIGIDNNGNTRLSEKQRLVIPSRYANKLNENFHAVNYADSRLTEALSRPYEKELIGNVPEGFQVIGKTKEGNIENIIIKPLKPKKLPGSPNIFDNTQGLTGFSIGSGSNFNNEIKNPDFYSDIMKLNKYSPKQKKYFEDLIATVKRQGNVATDKQYDELQRIKTGNTNYGKKGYSLSASEILKLSEEEILNKTGQSKEDWELYINHEKANKDGSYSRRLEELFNSAYEPTNENLQTIEQGKNQLLDFYSSSDYNNRLQRGLGIDFNDALNYQNSLINAINKTEPRFVQSRNAGTLESDAMAYTKGADSEGTKLGIDFSKRGLERSDAPYLVSHEYGHTSLYDDKNRKLLENLPKLELDPQALKLWESEAVKPGGQSYRDRINYYSNPDEARQRGITAILYSKNKGISIDELVDMPYNIVVNQNRTGELPSDILQLRQLYDQKDLKKYLKKLFTIVAPTIVGSSVLQNKKDGGIVSDLSKKEIDKLIKQGYIIEEID
jgi:hypothetical protein